MRVRPVCLVALALVVLAAAPLCAQTPLPPPPPPDAEQTFASAFVPGSGAVRGAPSATDQGLSATHQNATTRDFIGRAPFAFGFTTLVTKDAQTLSVPVPIPAGSLLGYDQWFSSLSVPYIFRNFESGGTRVADAGLGDVSLAGGAEYNFLGVMLTTTLQLKFPTGDWENEDRGVPLPFGTGMWEYAAFQDLSLDYRVVRFFTTFGFEYKPARSLTFAYRQRPPERFRIDNGEVFHYLVGASMPLGTKWLHWYLKGSGQLIEDGHIRTAPGRFRARDGLFTLDALLGLHFYLQEKVWFLPKGMGLKLGLVVPMYTAASSDEPGAEDRGLGVEIGVISEFSF